MIRWHTPRDWCGWIVGALVRRVNEVNLTLFDCELGVIGASQTDMVNALNALHTSCICICICICISRLSMQYE